MPPGASPLKAQGAANMTPVNKFDYVTRLVTQHEQAVTTMGIQLSELTRKTVDLEQKQVTELSILTTLRDRNVARELEGLKKDLDSVQKRMDAVNDDRSNDTRALQLGLIQGEVEKLKSQVSDLTRLHTAMMSGVEQLVARQVQALKSSILTAVEQQMEKHASALRGEMSEVRGEVSASSSTVEAASLQCNSLAVKLRSHMQACAQSAAALTQRMDGVTTSLEGLTGQVSGLEQDNKKIKKHVVKLERQVEGLQSMGSVAVAADKMMQEVKRSCDDMQAVVCKAQTQSEEAASLAKSASKRLHASESRMSQLHEAVQQQRMDMTAMAESLGSCMGQVVESARRHAAALVPSPQVSYLQNLLGPPSAAPSATAPTGISPLFSGLGLGLGRGLGGLPPYAQQQQQQQQLAPDLWDGAKRELDSFLQGLRARGVSSTAHATFAADGAPA